MANKDLLSDELLATYLDGNANKEETIQVLGALKTDRQLQEVLHIALETEDEGLMTPQKSKVTSYGCGDRNK